jgi:DNA primase catalytic core
MSLHKLTALDGYTYLTRQVAAADATHRGHESLGDFYAARGESPGLWTGSGLSGLAGIDPGTHVSAAQMKALFGKGRHPNADAISAAMIIAGHSPAHALRASKLGLAFYSYDHKSPFQAEVTRRFAEHNKELGLVRGASIAADVRTRIRTGVAAEMFADWHGHPPKDPRELSGFIARSSRKAMTAVAGYDLTFSPVKSVSALWAIASPEVATQIQEAHQGAVANTLGWLERDAVFTAVGTHGVRTCVKVTGLIAAAFTHRDARSGDPDLHTHVAVSNKVQTLNGIWMALDGRALFKAIVAAGERYDTRIEAELAARLGVRFEPRPAAGTSKRAVREVVGVDPALNTYWSSRRADIVVRRAVLSAEFQVNHGRTPTTIELVRLARQATLETRPAKHSPRSYADQRATWRAQATQVMGESDTVEAMVAAAAGSRHPGRQVTMPGATDQPVTGHAATGQAITGQWVGETAAHVVARVSVSRPAWQVWHVRAEAERAARAARVALADVDGAVDQVVAAALSPTHAVPLTSPAHMADPASARRRDGSSGHTVPGAARFTSRALMDTRANGVTAAQRTDGPATVVKATSAAPAAEGVTLSPAAAQPTAPRATAGTGETLAGAPAGSDKPARAQTRNNTEPPREDGSDLEAGQEALFHAARQREYAPAPDLDAFDTERQLVEANRWDHAPVARARLVELNEMAADFFCAGYANSWGPQYVSGRLGTDLADHPGFRPGYAPAGWTNLSDHLRHLGVRDQEILAAGLGRVARTGAIIDQFRDRLVMPIHNGNQVHGFIGRRHPDLTNHDAGGPKYLNTPRSDLFDKSAQLFGLTEAQTALAAGATPVLVEGFFDAIAVTLSAGGHHVGLACLGTSLTADQAGALRPYIGAQRPGVIVATDADLAGEIAAQRAFWVLASRGDTPRKLAMAGGQDPAEVLELGGPMALRAALADAQPLARHLLDERLSHLGDNPQVLAECAAIIAAQPPHTWMEQIDYAAARSNPGRGVFREAVADAARRWTLDPLGNAQTQIGDLPKVQTRLLEGANAPLSADATSDLDLAPGVAAKRRLQRGQSSRTNPERHPSRPLR